MIESRQVEIDPGGTAHTGMLTLTLGHDATLDSGEDTNVVIAHFTQSEPHQSARSVGTEPEPFWQTESGESTNSGGTRVPKSPGLRRMPGDYMRARAYHRANLDALRRRFTGQYVAIIADDVVDHDADFGSLARRAYEKYGYRPIYMPKIVARDMPVRIPSPRVHR